MKILVLNAGSSSQKSCLYDISEDIFSEIKPLWEAHIDWTIGQLVVQSLGKKWKWRLEDENRKTTIVKMLNTLVEGETKTIDNLTQIDIIGHRVVHGGTKYSQATLITPTVTTEIKKLFPLAPLHNPVNLEAIEIMTELLGDIPQGAVFDTAFHSQMPIESAIYPLPYEYFTQGIRRYGFHGTSHQYCANKTAELLNQPLSSLKMITCHLGNGCSLSAIKDGISINTTMGFTPLEGLMMGTRSGSIDPAILLYLMRNHNFTLDELDDLLNKKSGLKGVSGVSGDLRAILTAIEVGNEQAQLALDVYIHRLQSNISAMLPQLGGLDVLVFTAGVGENSAIIREKTCEAFEFMGLKLDRQKNNLSPLNQNIASSDSSIPIFIIHTEEDLTIAFECWNLKKSLKYKNQLKP
jgi:acetate kinase